MAIKSYIPMTTGDLGLLLIALNCLIKCCDGSLVRLLILLLRGRSLERPLEIKSADHRERKLFLPKPSPLSPLKSKTPLWPIRAQTEIYKS